MAMWLKINKIISNSLSKFYLLLFSCNRSSRAPLSLPLLRASTSMCSRSSLSECLRSSRDTFLGKINNKNRRRNWVPVRHIYCKSNSSFRILISQELRVSVSVLAWVLVASVPWLSAHSNPQGPCVSSGWQRPPRAR